MSAANGWITRGLGVDSAAGAGGGAVARGGSAAGAVRVSNVLVSRSRNFRQVGASSSLGRSFRTGSLFDPFFGTSALEAGGAFGSTCEAREPAGAGAAGGLETSRGPAGLCSEGRSRSGTSRDRRRGGASTGGRSPLSTAGGFSDR